MDEPTSGLDSANAINITKLLRKETSLGKCVMVSIHQPSYQIIQQFDRVICMAEGVSIYNGPTEDIPTYFQEHFGIAFKAYTNPSDFLIKMSFAPH